MARKKSNIGLYVGLGIGGFAMIVLVDHYVLKGRLGLAGYFNMLVGKIKQQFGVGAGPITPAPAPGPQAGLPSGATQFEGSPEEAALLKQYGTVEEQAIRAAEEDATETAAMARRRAMRAYGYPVKSRVRIGGMGY